MLLCGLFLNCILPPFSSPVIIDSLGKNCVERTWTSFKEDKPYHSDLLKKRWYSFLFLKTTFVTANRELCRDYEVTRCRTQRKKCTLTKKRKVGTKNCISNCAVLSVMLREAYVCKRDAPMFGIIRFWPLRRDDNSSILIGAAGTWRSNWRRLDVGVLIGQSARRRLA